ncbi:SDR family NAD(P)-dependent oxidoreductase [Corynebacterium freiburgense]|uniref:SDR family NAD(P)-dependent oxidoreductase n=1 Tax=Corynebacterium freiburgense TaxID=556548 RepID=UPI0004085708|nr:SDR family oxidoreductase [Corynebacterium freiburgense]WJZ02944.1 (S)-1-Phenylethanol dehydrogenase [Corynebacterium freiburgense]
MKEPVIISGATGGIGSSIAQKFVIEGQSVILLGRQKDKLNDLAVSLQKDNRSNVEIETVEVDINNPFAVDAAAAEILSHYGAPRAIVHAAGDHPVRTIIDSTDEEWRSAIEGKVLGAVRLIRAFGPSMRVLGCGSITLIAGLFRAEPSPLFPIGSVLNAALGAIVKATAKEFAVDGVRVNVVDPGPVATDRWWETCEELAEVAGSRAEDINQNTIKNIPLGRLVSPADVSNMVYFLSSEAASHVTGSSFVVDGGMSAGLV